DCGELSRVGGGAAELFERAPVSINIDHHVSNTRFAKLNYVDALVSSTCELIFGIITMFVPITKDMAESIYLGIITDTGSFRYPSTSPHTMEIVATLMRTGIDFANIQQMVMHNRSRVEIAIFTRAMQNLKYTDNGHIAYTSLSAAEMQAVGAEFSDLEGIAEQLLNISDIKASILLTERPGGRVKASFRSRGADVNKVAGCLCGGGHKYAAAAVFEAGSFEEGIKLALETLNDAVCAHLAHIFEDNA
ncbi:MAG: DHHA1 domain-containing protein, partial [Defluviitaleaceae bacterium]|nr:DHHA1 domain-containing protein [Defluviitaleaceae bacterium]